VDIGGAEANMPDTPTYPVTAVIGLAEAMNEAAQAAGGCAFSAGAILTSATALIIEYGDDAQSYPVTALYALVASLAEETIDQLEPAALYGEAAGGQFPNDALLLSATALLIAEHQGEPQ
jgi:hypothetical protein